MHRDKYTFDGRAVDVLTTAVDEGNIERGDSGVCMGSSGLQLYKPHN